MLTGRGFSRHLAGPALQQGFAAFAGVVAIGLVVRALA